MVAIEVWFSEQGDGWELSFEKPNALAEAPKLVLRLKGVDGDQRRYQVTPGRLLAVLPEGAFDAIIKHKKLIRRVFAEHRAQESS